MKNLEIKEAPEVKVGDFKKPKERKVSSMGGISIPEAKNSEGKGGYSYINKKIVLHTPEVQRNYNSTYKRVVGCVLSMHTELMKVGRMDDYDNYVSRYLNEVFRISKEEVDSEIDTLMNSDFDLDGHDGMVTPSRCEFVVPVHNPSLKNFLDLILKIDELIVLVNFLFITEQISGEAKGEYIYKWPHFIKQTSGRVHKVTEQVKRLARKEKGDLQKTMNDLISGLIKYKDNITKIK